MNYRSPRNPRGQAVIVTAMITAFFLVLSVGLFAFELNRVEVARQQLKSACEAAALAGAATLASSDENDPSRAHSNASATALHTFQQNSVAGTSLGEADMGIDQDANPAPHESSLYVEFQNPHNNNAPVTPGDPRGKIVKVYGALGFVPAFGQYLGIGNVPLKAEASGGVPQLDLVLAFDVSASIDDQTPVTFVRRQWNGTTRRTDYVVATAAAGSRAGGTAEGTIYDIVGPPATGSAVDGLPPQTLQAANQGDHRWRLNFSEIPAAYRRPGSAIGLRGAGNASPPGNMSAGSGVGNAQTFTDLVVNIDGRTRFQGITSNGYAFPSLATVVEAARGNLEDMGSYTSSRANVSLPAEVQPRVGYRAEYERLARMNLHPLREAQEACSAFLQIMNTNTDAHFSLVSFSTQAGRNDRDTIRMPNIDATYAPGGNGDFANAMIEMNPSPLQTGYDSCLRAINNTTPISGTNIGDAVNTAVNQLNANGRTGAKKAIVVFTDGQPTSPGPLDNVDPWRNSREAAYRARQAGIPIYSIGLAQVPEIIPGETAILNDTNSNRANGGISGIAGNGGRFWLVTSNANLRLTFENLARQLVQLVR